MRTIRNGVVEEFIFIANEAYLRLHHVKPFGFYLKILKAEHCTLPFLEIPVHTMLIALKT